MAERPTSFHWKRVGPSAINTSPTPSQVQLPMCLFRRYGQLRAQLHALRRAGSFDGARKLRLKHDSSAAAPVSWCAMPRAGNSPKLSGGVLLARLRLIILLVAGLIPRRLLPRVRPSRTSATPLVPPKVLTLRFALALTGLRRPHHLFPPCAPRGSGRRPALAELLVPRGQRDRVRSNPSIGWPKTSPFLEVVGKRLEWACPLWAPWLPLRCIVSHALGG